jgi:pimeloyl-ACP methyl ester carboxylesterase
MIDFNLTLARLFCFVSLLLSLGRSAYASSFNASPILIRGTNGKIERALYTELGQPRSGLRTAPNDVPTVVLLNGLIYDINRWNSVAEKLVENGVQVVRLSFTAQPESLRLLKKGNEPPFLREGLDLKSMAEDVQRVLQHHGITGPVTVVGLSYGATVATTFAKLYPQRIHNLVLLSPLVIPLDSYDPSSKQLRDYLEVVRFWENSPCMAYGWLNPWLCSSTDRWYDAFYNFFYESYLNLRVQKVPPDLDPMIYKKSVFQLVRAVRDFDLRKEALSLTNFHLVISEKEEIHLKADQLKAWSLTRPSERKSLAEFKNVVHALPDEAPTQTARWIQMITERHEVLQRGDEFIIE